MLTETDKKLAEIMHNHHKYIKVRHMSHDLGAVTILRFLELGLGLGLGLD